MFALIGLEEGVAKRRDLSLLRGTRHPADACV